MLIVFLINRKDYEPFLADVVFVFDGLGNFRYGILFVLRISYCVYCIAGK